MWRWIAIILIAVIVVLAGTCYAGYRRLTGGGDTIVTMVPGTPARTFARLTDRDSLRAWMPEGTTMSPEGRGSLRVGDTIRVALPTRRETPTGRAFQVWIVRELKPPEVVAVEGIDFDQGGLPHPAFTRRDSLSAVGDSTRIVSTFVGVPLLSGPAESAATSGRPGAGSVLNVAERVRLGASRLLWQNQLRRLAGKGP